MSQVQSLESETAFVETSDDETVDNPDQEVDGDEDEKLDEAFAVSAELRRKEQEYIRLNKELQSESAKVVRNVESVVREGKESLVRPSTAPSTAKAAEDDVRSASHTPAKRPQTSRSSGQKVPKSNPEEKRTRPIQRLDEPDSNKERVGSSRPPGHDYHHDEAIGSEASNRILKAKLQAMQEDVERLVAEHETKNDMIKNMDSKLKTVDAERAKSAKALMTAHAQEDKFKKQNESLRKRAEEAEVEVAKLRKELDSQNRAQKNVEADGNAKDVRLNRALGEVERHKQAAAKANAEVKEKLEQSKKTNEKLLGDLRRCQKQKTELLTAFRKQAQLVDVLKRQKLHLEAAKLLDFTEEEFMRALNWEAA
ncbi:hypothetical protein DFS34DRAFT_614512 [Phlyctochytrium arcticum]|nr:hypothetical protein DFS34DRAFT_614512 [Phlyctochytrium arcticum]